MSLSKRMSAWLPLALVVILAASLMRPAHAQTSATVYEGARLITGDGAVIENAAFVIENGHFTEAGPRADVQIPAGAVRVDLTGKTVMPTLVDLHGHLGFQNIAAGRMSKETFTRDNLVDHLRRLAFNGVGAVVGVGDLIDRTDMKGGRTGWGDVVLRVRDEVIPDAALFKTAGAGIAWPGSGAQGDPSRVDVAYPVTTPDEARAAVRDYVRMNPVFIKIWVDDRAGRIHTLTPPLYGAILDEAHKFGIPVGVHNVTLADAKEMVRGGMEGWLHVPVRGGEVADDELVALVRDRIARNDWPDMWMTLSLITAWMNTHGGGRPAFLDDPLLRAAYSPAQIEKYWGEPLRTMTPERIARASAQFLSDARSAMLLRRRRHPRRRRHRYRPEPIPDRLLQPSRSGKHGGGRDDPGRGDHGRDPRRRRHREIQHRPRRCRTQRRFHRARCQSSGRHREHAPDRQGFPARAGSSACGDGGEMAGGVQAGGRGLGGVALRWPRPAQPPSGSDYAAAAFPFGWTSAV